MENVEGQKFVFPDIYQFPPFFTKQVNERTWKAQCTSWIDLILSYCEHYKIWTLDLDRTRSSTQDTSTPHGEIDGELFRNPSINRGLNIEVIREIFRQMVDQGRGEWDKGESTDLVDYSDSYIKGNKTSGKETTLLVYFKSPQEWANVITDWIDRSGQNGTVFTLYELSYGELVEGEPFYSIHPAILRRVVDILVQRGKAALMTGDGNRIAGVKIL
uniref:ARAD1C33374p n=1 Tax=Blastobotrys adeninivorans TaxID=409370 RepID=A0A060T3H2_BLAAD